MTVEPSLPNLTEAFARARLLDVAYALEDSPVGPLLLAGTPRGLVRVAYLLDGGREDQLLADLDGGRQDQLLADLDGGRQDQLLADLAARVSPRVLAAPRRLDPVRRQLEEFFAGSRRRFELPLDWRLVRGEFATAVLRATARIRYGGVSTYGEVAAAAGSPRASRAAGSALARNPLPIVVPCHRVLAAGGGFGGYTGGLDRKRRLLEIEGALPGRG